MVRPPQIHPPSLDDDHNSSVDMCTIKCFDLSPGDKPNALAEPRGEEESLTKKGKKKKTVHWAEEEQLKHYFYFDLDETERGRTELTQ